MATADDVLCRAADLNHLYEVLTDTPSSTVKPLGCPTYSTLDDALNTFEEDQAILDSVEDYDRKLRVWTIRNNHKMNKTDLFLELYGKHHLGELKGDADQLECMGSQMEEMNEDWCQSRSNTSLCHNSMCYNCTSTVADKIDIKIPPCDTASKSFKTLNDLERTIDSFNLQIDQYDMAATDAAELLLQNGEDIQKFARDRRLDALITSENYNNISNSLVYKNYQTKIERVIDSYNATIDKMTERLDQVIVPFHEATSDYTEICNDLFNTRDLDDCSEQLGLTGRQRRASNSNDDEDFDDEGSGEGSDEGSGENPPPAPPTLNCPDHSEPVAICVIDQNLTEAAGTVKYLTNHDQVPIISDKINNVIDEQVLKDLGRWCPDAAHMKREPFLKNGKIIKEYEQVLEECLTEGPGLYIRSKRAIEGDTDDSSSDLEMQIINFPVPPITTDCSNEQLCTKNENGHYLDGDKAQQVVDKHSQLVIDQSTKKLSNDLQHAPAKNCPDGITLEELTGREYDSYDCSLTHFDHEAQAAIDQIHSLKGARQAYQNKEDEINALLNDVKSMSALAKSLIESSVSEYIPAYIDSNDKQRDEPDNGNTWSDEHNLPEAIYESFKYPSNGLDLKFSLQTIATQYAYLYYIGSKSDFDITRPTRRRRKKRSTRVGDSIFISIEGHTTDENLQDSMLVTRTSTGEAQQPIIKVDLWTKDDQHHQLSAPIGEAGMLFIRMGKLGNEILIEAKNT